MSTTTPYLGLTLYDNSGDQAVTFATFRAVWGGTATTSNFYKIDTSASGFNSRISALETLRGAIPVSALFISANFYQATGVSTISAYNTGMTIILSVDTTSSGTVTLDINSLGTKSVMKVDSTGTAINLTGSDLVKGRQYLFVYDGSRWLWVSANSADQIQIVGTAGNVVTVGSTNNLLGTTTQAGLIADTTHAATTKTTPADNDEFPITDSAASYVLKRLTWSNLKTTFLNYWYSIWDGWIPDSSTWTYSSADGSTGIASVNTNIASRIQKGYRIKYYQSQALTGYWSFNSSSTPEVGGFTCTDTSMTYTAGKFSNAATYNGTTSKIVVTDASGLKPTGEYTVGMWFKTSNTGADKTMFQSYSLNTNWAGILIQISSANVLRVYHGKNTGTTSGVDYTTVTGTTTVTDGNFHYLVVSFRNNFIQVYLDGVLEVSGSMVTPAYAGTNYPRIGCGNNSGTDLNFMNGQIDDLYFINGYALDEKTIYDRYILNSAQGSSNIDVNKVGIVTNVGAWSGSATLITFWGGTDYSLANATISNPYFSASKVPVGFPILPAKWTVLVTDIANAGKTTPTASTWYGDTSLSPTGANISIPIGSWFIEYSGTLDMTATTASVGTVGGRMTLSTSASAESDSSMSRSFATTLPIVTGGIIRMPFNLSPAKMLTLATKTTYYLDVYANVSTITALNIRGDLFATVISARCAYL